MGDVEMLTVNLYNKAMNVNFYGALRTIRSLLYLARQSKGLYKSYKSYKSYEPRREKTGLRGFRPGPT